MSQVWLLRRVGCNADEQPLPLKAGLNKIGRSPKENSISLHSLWVSKAHCQVTISHETIFIEDLGSSNGTFVNSNKLDAKRRTELKAGDIISIGKLYSKDDEPLPPEHYVYKVILCGIPKPMDDTQQRCEKTKRKSSSSPKREAPKRLCSLSPAKDTAQASTVCEVVDLTDDDSLSHPSECENVRKNISTASPPKSDCRVIDFLDLTDSTNCSKTATNHDFPLAQSTLLNGSTSKEEEETKLISMLQNAPSDVLKNIYEKIFQKRILNCTEVNKPLNSFTMKSPFREKRDEAFKKPLSPIRKSPDKEKTTSNNLSSTESLTSLDNVKVFENNKVSEPSSITDLSSPKINSVISLSEQVSGVVNKNFWGTGTNSVTDIPDEQIDKDYSGNKKANSVDQVKAATTEVTNKLSSNKRRRRFGVGEDDLQVKNFIIPNEIIPIEAHDHVGNSNISSDTIAWSRSESLKGRKLRKISRDSEKESLPKQSDAYRKLNLKNLPGRRKTIDLSDCLQNSNNNIPLIQRRNSTESVSSVRPEGESQFMQYSNPYNLVVKEKTMDEEQEKIERLLVDLESTTSETLSQVIHASKDSIINSNSGIEASYSITDIEEQLLDEIIDKNKNMNNFSTVGNVGDIHIKNNDNVDSMQDELSNSFSQEGAIEVDDDMYSSFFEVIDVDDDDAIRIPVPQPHVTIIKEEVDDEVVEEDDFNDQLFKTYFSQCSEEVEAFVSHDVEELVGSKNNTKNDAKELSDLLAISDNMTKDIGEDKQMLINSNHEMISKKAIIKELPSHSEGSLHACDPSPTDATPKTNALQTFPKLSGSKLVKSTLLSQPPVKKEKNKKSLAKLEPSATRDALQKKNRQRLNEERKAKLKKIALMKNHDKGGEATSVTICNKENQNEAKETGKVTLSKIAKVTERNRGTILLEGLSENPEVKRTRSKSKQASEASCIASVELLKLKSCFKQPLSCKSLVNKKNVSFSEKVETRSFECEGSLFKKVDRSSSKDNKLIPYAQRNNHLEFRHLLDKFIFNVVHWNTSWIQESKIVKGDPKLSSEDVYRGKEIYVSFDDYQRWLLPLIYHELWANLVKSMDEKDSHKSTKVFNGVIIHEEPRKNSPNNRLLILKCCVPMKGKDIPMLVDPQDNVIVSEDVRNAEHSKEKKMAVFGFVDSQVRVTNARYMNDPTALRYVNSFKEAPEVCAYFDVAVQNRPQMRLKSGCSVRIRFTYNMRNEMTQYESLNKLRLSPLLGLITDPEKNLNVELPKNLENIKPVSTFPLNEDQKNAVLGTCHLALAGKPTISLIHGPPGTGKSRVIIGIIEQLVHHFRSKSSRERSIIMITAQCNSAVDEICLRMLDIRKQLPSEKRFKLARFGRKERVNPKVHDILTSTLAQKQVEKVNLEEALTLDYDLLKAKESTYATMMEAANKEEERLDYKRLYINVQERIHRLEPFVKKKNVSEDLKRKEISRLVAEEELRVILHSDIIATTLGSCTSRRIINALNEHRDGMKRKIGLCIIDEATQATEADTLLPLVHGIQNFILVGDQQQLPPFVSSKTSKENGLSCSLFERLYNVWNKLKSTKEVPIFPLTVQHRMHPEIATFPSATFYEGQLKTPDYLNLNRGYRPYALFTHSFKESSNSETNPEEANLILNILDQIVDNHLFKSLTIGIVVPYQQQKSYLFDLVHGRKYHRVVTVNTIDSYQGQEKDVIILSTVRTNGIGFLSDYQRMNVAITRAKKALYIFGNFSSLQGEPIWKNLLTDAKKRKAHLDVSKKSPSEVMEFLTASKKRKRSNKSIDL